VPVRAVARIRAAIPDNPVRAGAAVAVLALQGPGGLAPLPAVAGGKLARRRR